MCLNAAGVLYALLLPVFLVEQISAQKRADAEMVGGDKVAGSKVMESGADKFGLSRIGQIAIPVDDLDRATAFYRDKLGMKYLFTADGMAFLDAGGIRLMLARLGETQSSRVSSVVYFKVDDISEGYEALSGRGVRFDEEPELAARTQQFDLWLACFKDSENNNLCLMSEVGRK